MFTCGTCNICIKDRSNFKKHLETHKVNRERKYSCPKCGETFLHTFQLKRHKEKANDKRRIYKCLVVNCCSGFTTDTLLKHHLEQVHKLKTDGKKLEIGAEMQESQPTIKYTESTEPESHLHKSTKNSTPPASSQSQIKSTSSQLAHKATLKALKKIRTPAKVSGLFTSQTREEFTCTKTTFQPSSQNTSGKLEISIESPTSTSAASLSESPQVDQSTFDKEDYCISEEPRLDAYEMGAGKDTTMEAQLDTFALTAGEIEMWGLNGLIHIRALEKSTLPFGLKESLLCFLKGEQKNMTVEEFVVLSDLELENYVGAFALALYAVDIINQMDFKQIATTSMLLRERNCTSLIGQVASIFTESVFVRYVEEFGEDAAFLESLDTKTFKLYDPMKANIKNNNVVDANSTLALERVLTLAIKSNWKHLAPGIKVSKQDRAEREDFWKEIMTRVLNKLANEETVSVSCAAAQVASERRVGTVQCLVITSDKEAQVSFHVHPFILKQLTGSSTFTKAAELRANVGEKDLELMREKLYNKTFQFPLNQVREVHVKILLALKVLDPWGLLFGSRTFEDLYAECDGKIITSALLQTQKKEGLEFLAKKLAHLYSKREIYGLFNGLEAAKVVHFFSTFEHKLDMIDVYHCLLTWSYWKAEGKLCNVYAPEKNKDAKKNFETVMHVIDLDAMPHDLQRLVRDRVFPLKPVVAAIAKLRIKAGNENQVDPKRTRNE